MPYWRQGALVARDPRRAEPRRCGILAVVLEPCDQRAQCHRRASCRDRPVTYDPATYRDRNTVQRSFNRIEQWRTLVTRYDEHALVYRGGAPFSQ